MTIPIITSNGKLHLLSSECCARWMCLIEALDVISKDAEKKGIDLDKDNSWIKPIAIKSYMEERYPAMHHDIQVEHNLD